MINGILQGRMKIYHYYCFCNTEGAHHTSLPIVSTNCFYQLFHRVCYSVPANSGSVQTQAIPHGRQKLTKLN